MSIATATPAQLAQLSAHVVAMRALIGQFARTMNSMAALDVAWKANVAAIIGTPTGATVTDTSGLAGIVPLTDTQVSTLMTDIENLLATYNTNAAQQVYVLACGAGNLT